MNIPFAAFAHPGVETITFFASPSHASEPHNQWDHDRARLCRQFFINFFGNDEEYVAAVSHEMNARQVIDYAKQMSAPFPGAEVDPGVIVSTEYFKYLAVVREIIGRLKKGQGSKVVFSKVTVERSSAPVWQVADDYFSLFPDTFRFLCFTQETGAWMGCSPELLADYDTEQGVMSTMALAGTRTADEQWDNKNVNEHGIVASHIVNVLENLDARDICVSESDEVGFGDLRHLRTRIEARLNGVSPRGLLCRLSPTPALAGSPLRWAMPVIFESETHSRLCYGGFVGEDTGSRVTAYVNLRSALVSHDSHPTRRWRYTIYSGGGIMPKSNPVDEWNEATAKAEPLRSAVVGRNDQPWCPVNDENIVY